MRKRILGPGAVVAAAFIGPGTVTACTLAGAHFGMALLWALVFATVSTVILQSMAARLGVVAQLGVGEALVHQLPHPVASRLWIGLVCLALGVGNAAYEGGNLTGAVLGWEAVTGSSGDHRWVVVCGLVVIVGAVLLWGKYSIIEGFLVGMVLLMALAFSGAVVLVRPPWGMVLGGLAPSLPEGSALTAAALVGTTIVPYNVFLHAATVRERWSGGPNSASVSEALRDTYLSVSVGGVVSMCILITAAVSLNGEGREIQDAADFVIGLESVYGLSARYLIGGGLLAAGISSALTAPLATAYAFAELFPIADDGRKKALHRLVAVSVLGVGGATAASGASPVSIILLAQVANAVLLPIVSIGLLYCLNQSELMGAGVNRWWTNVMGSLVVAVTIFLSCRAWLFIDA